MTYLTRAQHRLAQRLAPGGDAERGDVPGWVLVTLMTAGLVAGLWLVAGPALEDLFIEALESARG